MSRLSRRSQRRVGPSTPSADGGYSIVEAAITLPVIIVMTMLVVQYALLWHGRHVAESAARDGLEAARGYEALPGAGQAAARGYLADVAPRLLTAPNVRVTRTPTTVRVLVTAHVVRVVPFGDYAVSESVQGPLERFIASPANRSGGPLADRASRPGME